MYFGLSLFELIFTSAVGGLSLLYIIMIIVYANTKCRVNFFTVLLRWLLVISLIVTIYVAGLYTLEHFGIISLALRNNLLLINAFGYFGVTKYEEGIALIFDMFSGGYHGRALISLLVLSSFICLIFSLVKRRKVKANVPVLNEPEEDPVSADASAGEPDSEAKTEELSNSSDGGVSAEAPAEVSADNPDEKTAETVVGADNTVFTDLKPAGKEEKGRVASSVQYVENGYVPDEQEIKSEYDELQPKKIDKIIDEEEEEYFDSEITVTQDLINEQKSANAEVGNSSYTGNNAQEVPVTRRMVITNRLSIVNMFNDYLNEKSAEEKQRLAASISQIKLNK